MNNPNEHLDFINQMLSETDHLHQELPPESSPPASDNEILELGDGFDFDGFQVVRREFFAHTYEPSVSFNNCKFYVNSACLQKFPEADTVQVLVNKDTKILAIMPCPENARDSFAWCTTSKGKRKPKQITCKLFFAKVVSMMDWNPDYRYKILGKQIHANGEYLIAFDLTATEIYKRTTAEGSKPKTARIPVFPAEWQNQFGLPYSEHRQSMQVNILDGYAVYSIKDSQPDKSPDEAADGDVPAAVLAQLEEVPDEKL
ncbi:MAG: hypothetical protein IJK38_00055 [Oscillospiraceae bacterium]|nr:hypothetical protein [Oscillospiraceae bacterium]